MASLAEKLLKIRASLDNIPKNGWNQPQSYAYHKDEDIINALKEAFTRENILWLSQCLEVQVENGESKSGNNSYLTTAKMHYVLINGENPDEQLTFVWHGQGNDSGDKGIYKAFTGAGKTFLMKLFMISEGNDPEADHKEAPSHKPQQSAQRNYTPSNSQHKGPIPTEPQLLLIKKLCNELSLAVPEVATKAEANVKIQELNARKQAAEGKEQNGG